MATPRSDRSAPSSPRSDLPSGRPAGRFSAAPIDVDRARSETPGCAHVAHLNHAGCSLAPQPVLDAQADWLAAEAITGGYELAADRADDRAATYDEVASLIGARPDEIAVVENATFAWHQAFWSLDLQPGDRVLTADVEYATGFVSMLQARRRLGVHIEVIPDDEHGQVSVEALARRLDDDRAGPVGLVALTHAPTNGGLVNPAEEVGRLTRAAGVPYLLDACQSVGQMPVDVAEIGCDLLSTTGRKYLRGPRGTGFLYVRRELGQRLQPPFLDLHAATWVAPDRYEMRPDARRFENWETNFAGKIGLGVAIDYARAWGMAAIWDRVRALASRLRAELEEIPGVTVRDIGAEQCGIVTFTADGIEARQVKQALAARSINVTTSTVASTRFDMEARGLHEIVRASVHYYNDEAEITRFCESVRLIGL